MTLPHWHFLLEEVVQTWFRVVIPLVLAVNPFLRMTTNLFHWNVSTSKNLTKVIRSRRHLRSNADIVFVTTVKKHTGKPTQYTCRCCCIYHNGKTLSHPALLKSRGESGKNNWILLNRANLSVYFSVGQFYLIYVVHLVGNRDIISIVIAMFGSALASTAPNNESKTDSMYFR